MKYMKYLMKYIPIDEIIIQCEITMYVRYFKRNIYLLMPNISRFCVIYTMHYQSIYGF